MKHLLDVLDNSTDTTRYSDNSIGDSNEATSEHSDCSVDDNDKETTEYKLLNLIDSQRYNNRYNLLLILGRIIKSLGCFNCPFNIWLELCNKTSNNNVNKLLESWHLFKHSTYTIKTIQYYARQDNKERYFALTKSDNLDQLYNTSEIGNSTIDINERYLLDKDKGLEDNSV